MSLISLFRRKPKPAPTGDPGPHGNRHAARRGGGADVAEIAQPAAGPVEQPQPPTLALNNEGQVAWTWAWFHAHRSLHRGQLAELATSETGHLVQPANVAAAAHRLGISLAPFSRKERPAKPESTPAAPLPPLPALRFTPAGRLDWSVLAEWLRETADHPGPVLAEALTVAAGRKVTPAAVNTARLRWLDDGNGQHPEEAPPAPEPKPVPTATFPDGREVDFEAYHLERRGEPPDPRNVDLRRKAPGVDNWGDLSGEDSDPITAGLDAELDLAFGETAASALCPPVHPERGPIIGGGEHMVRRRALASHARLPAPAPEVRGEWIPSDNDLARAALGRIVDDACDRTGKPRRFVVARMIETLVGELI